MIDAEVMEDAKLLTRSARKVEKTRKPAECVERGKGYTGDEIIQSRHITTPKDCQQFCQETEGCVVWTLDRTDKFGGCWLDGINYKDFYYSDLGPKGNTKDILVRGSKYSRA